MTEELRLHMAELNRQVDTLARDVTDLERQRAVCHELARDYVAISLTCAAEQPRLGLAAERMALLLFSQVRLIDRLISPLCEAIAAGGRLADTSPRGQEPPPRA
jgi:hypothetical protein